jgi:hypothetical protein
LRTGTDERRVKKLLTVLRFAASIGIGLFGIDGVGPGAIAATYSEEALKAAFLHRFAAYVEWPLDAVPEQTFTIGVFGAQPVVTQLERLLPTLTIQGRAAQARTIARTADLENVSILYIGRGQLTRARAVLTLARTRPILVVTDDTGGLGQGAAINFLEDKRHVRFEVSLPAADRSRLKISAALLAIAARVEGRPQAELSWSGVVVVHGPWAHPLAGCPLAAGAPGIPRGERCRS